MMEIGRLCMKIAGRDGNKTCVVVDILDDNYVLIDGETRRKKCNIKHLEPLDKVIKIKKDTSRDEIKKFFTDMGLNFFDPKSKSPEPRVKRQKVKKDDVKKKESVSKPKEKVKEESKPEIKKDESKQEAEVKSEPEVKDSKK